MPKRSGPKQIALDLGTANTRLYHRGLGLVLEEPTALLLKATSNDVVAVGSAAVSRRDEPATRLVRPLEHGTAADAELLELYVTKLLNPYGGGLFSRQHVVVTVPSASSPLERRLIRETVQTSGPDHVHVIEHVLAAALGAGIALHEPIGSMIVDLGAGKTEAALLSLGAVVAASSVRFGGLDVDRAIQAKLRRDFSMTVSDYIAQEIKIATSTYVPYIEKEGEADLPLIEARGASIMDGSLVTAIVELDEFAPILREYWKGVLEAVRATLVQAPPELGQDLFNQGITLVGEAAIAQGLVHAIEIEFAIPVNVQPEPGRAVIMGAAKCLEAPDAFADLFLGEKGLA